MTFVKIACGTSACNFPNLLPHCCCISMHASYRNLDYRNHRGLGWPKIQVAKGLHSSVLNISSGLHSTSWEIKEKANGTVNLGTETKMKRSSTEGELRFWNQKVLGSFSTSVLARFVTFGKCKTHLSPKNLSHKMRQFMPTPGQCHAMPGA